MVNFTRIKLTAVQKKSLHSLLLVGIGLLAYSGALNTLVGRSAVGRMDLSGQAYLQDTFKKAVGLFAVVRGINGVISVVQNTAVAVSPAGVGVNLALGEILDPVDDLIERFSEVLLVSTTALGVQMVFARLGTWLGLEIILPLALLLLAAGMWFTGERSGRVKAFGVRLAAVALVIRFCVPLVSLVGDRIYAHFLAAQYETAAVSFGEMEQEVKGLEIREAPGAEEPASGLVQGAKQFYQHAVSAIQLEKKLQRLKDKMGRYAEHTINLIIVFVLQTILIPLAILWVFLRLAASAAAAVLPAAPGRT